uniref:(California timema) hypothetical protein n=1 Tax=Timema californicum TaxID=61474 RepID=A0A7R9J188_TIMCA|nr:unnamed protein product [Timema californicum]
MMYRFRRQVALLVPEDGDGQFSISWFGSGLTGGNAGGLNPAGQLTLAALAGSQLRTNNQNRNQPGANQQSHEMTVPNELIGCIIGKGGTKIAEIRQISGAMIRISNCEEREGGTTDRTITIQGNPDSVALAQYLINMRNKLKISNTITEEINMNPQAPSFTSLPKIPKPNIPIRPLVSYQNAPAYKLAKKLANVLVVLSSTTEDREIEVRISVGAVVFKECAVSRQCAVKFSTGVDGKGVAKGGQGGAAAPP